MNLGDKFFRQYEAELQRTERMASISTFVYGFTWFLGFCALTWASAVILGGLLSGLTRHDYYSTVVLLLLESVRLATTSFHAKSVTSKVIVERVDLPTVAYRYSRYSENLLVLRHFLKQPVQLMVPVISIVVPIRRLLDLNASVTGIEDGQFDVTKTSLRIFYALVLLNGSIAVLAMMFSLHVVPFVLDSIPLRKYYEKIVWMGMDVGLLHATDFDFLAWALQVQADEYRSNERAWVVSQEYKDLVMFLYYHPKLKGFEAVTMALDSSDMFEREAAANIVGLWVSLVEEMEQSKTKGRSVEERESDVEIASASSSTPVEAESKAFDKQKATELSRLLMQTDLLAKLADMIGNNETGVQQA